MSSTFQYIKRHFYIEAGLGVQFMLSSKTILPKDVAGIGGVYKFKNREFKIVMPVVPVAMGWRGELMIYCVRLEPGLLNRYSHDLKQYGSNFNGLISLEVGMKI